MHSDDDIYSGCHIITIIIGVKGKSVEEQVGCG